MTDRSIDKPSRRAFLFGASHADSAVRKPAALRPPWSVAESDFAASCTGCNDCVVACPESILVLDADQLAAVDFRRGGGLCTFCAACADICAVPAFLDSAQRATTLPWTQRAVIAETCLTHTGIMCQSCKDACGDAAIRFVYGASRVPRPVIDLERCTGCGACLAPCPAEAIAITPQDIPQEPAHA